MRELDILTVDRAIALMGLFLRSRGQCLVPGEITSFREWDALPPWWFYRVGAWAVLPEAHIWSEHWPADKRANRTPDWAGLELYDDPPIQGLIGRIANGLRVRDRVLSGMLALEGNESHQVVLYDTESLMLQLSSTLDLLAKIIRRQFNLNIPSHQLAWTRGKFPAALRAGWSQLSDDALSNVSTTAQLLALIRNRIHAGPLMPVAGDDTVLFALASEDQAKFESLAGRLGGAVAWGVVENKGLQGKLVDPWELAQQATLVTHHALRTVARLSVQRFPSTTVSVQVWPWDPDTAEIAMLYLGLQRAADECAPAGLSYPSLLTEASGSDRIHPVYPYGALGEPIELYSGPIAVDSGDRFSGRIYADLAGDLQVRWQVSASARPFQPGYVNLKIDHPDFGSTTVPALLNRGRGVGLIMDATLGSTDAECDHVIAHFTNLPMIFPAGSGRWQRTGAGWELTLEGRSDHAEVLDELRGSQFFAVTHVGRLRRVDGSTFKASEAAEVLEAWQVALSFALSRWIAPVAPVGFDVDGRRVWEQWGSWRCSPAYRYIPWWSNGDGDDLEHFVDRFLGAWFASEDEHDVVRYVAHHIIAAHHNGTTIEARIMLVHAALEYLSWVTYVLSSKRTASQHTKNKNGTPAATWHLRELLRPAKIKVAIPTQLPALRKFARQEGVPSGPAAVSRLRNRLVHPKDAGEPYRIDGLAFQAWQLGSEYAELLLLRRIGYQGKYLPRSNTTLMNSIPVPWTK
jgi:hypothetical protein